MSKGCTADARALSTPPPTPPASGGGVTVAAFTLVELSVVLVIIGLLVGGVMAAQSMIRSAQMNQMIREAQSYEAAIRLFKDKYGYYPGDMPNASDFWSGANNGDGDGAVEVSNNERFYAWQHLGLSGLIKGSYTGTGGTEQAGVNVPGTSMDAGYFRLEHTGIGGNTLGLFSPHGTALVLMLMGAGGNFNVLTPQEAHRIDRKLDDGMPGTGKVLGYHSNCMNGSGPTSWTGYKLSTDNQDCGIIFVVSGIVHH